MQHELGLSQIPDKKIDSKRLDQGSGIILFPNRKDPKYKCTGKTRIYHVQENLNGKAQVRRARFQIYLTKIKTDFQSHKDSVFFINTIQEIKNDKIIFKEFKMIKKTRDQKLNQDRLKTGNISIDQKE